MRESRTYGSGRGACHEMHVPTATGVARHQCLPAVRNKGPKPGETHPVAGQDLVEQILNLFVEDERFLDGGVANPVGQGCLAGSCHAGQPLSYQNGYGPANFT